MTGSEYIIKFLKEKSTDTVFCYPGVAVLDLFDALGKSDIEHILVRHEQGAVFAASGYARASGKVGVCIATSGPGAVNLTTGITDANLDSVPLLIITGQVNSAYIGRDAFQEADIMGITIPVTKHNYLVKDTKKLKSTLEEAYRISLSGRCGPVLVDITKDVLAAELEEDDGGEIILPRKRNNDYPLDMCLNGIITAIEASHRPIILAGGGVVSSDADKALSDFSKKSGIPVITTLMGTGIKLNDGVNCYGMTGVYGNPAAKEALWQSDLCIAVGCRFSDRTIKDFKSFEGSRRIIHCDIDKAEIDKNVKADIATTTDAKVFFETLLQAEISYNHTAHKKWSEQLDEIKRKHEIIYHQNRLSNWEIVRSVNNCVLSGGKYLYVCDVGDFQMSCARELEPVLHRGFITSGGLGAMGFSLPAAIGASFAVKDKADGIVVLCGDGGFQMSIQELSTLKNAKCPIKIFVFDNSSLRMIKNKQNELYDGFIVDSELKYNPDFEKIAEAYEISHRTVTVSERENIDSIIEGIMKSKDNEIVICKV